MPGHLMQIDNLNSLNTDTQHYTNNDMNLKITQFYRAMELYNNNPFYGKFERVISILVVFLQSVTLLNLVHHIHGANLVICISMFLLGYLITDFINGLVHMFMDNNTAYSSIAGPFIAAFHLHHAHPRYNNKHPLKIYFYESGTKFWLPVFLVSVVWLQNYVTLYYGINICLVSIGILSSIAELSHYWCHNATSKNKIVQTLQKYRLLLLKQHHLNHHRYDNTHYAFLNGMTDPAINLIARYCYQGYKNHADKHTEAYIQCTGTTSRKQK